MTASTRKHALQFSILVLLVLALLAGTVTLTQAAAQAAIPGDALYPVKTSIELARLTLAKDAGVRAEMRMAFAEQRLQEIRILIEEGRFQEVGRAVLAFEMDINQAILELETVSSVDPARAARLALEITSALTRYAQALSVMAASAPESVQTEVARALNTTQIVGSLEMPAAASDDNSNGNGDDGSSNTNGIDDNANSNGDDGNSNSNDDDGNSNSNGDDGNSNNNGDDGNGNGDDDSLCNENESDCDDDGANGNDDNSNGDDSNSNDDDSNDNGDDSNDNDSDSNDNGDDDSNGNDDSGSGGGRGGGGNGNDDD